MEEHAHLPARFNHTCPVPGTSVPVIPVIGSSKQSNALQSHQRLQTKVYRILVRCFATVSGSLIFFSPKYFIRLADSAVPSILRWWTLAVLIETRKVCPRRVSLERHWIQGTMYITSFSIDPFLVKRILIAKSQYIHQNKRENLVSLFSMTLPVPVPIWAIPTLKLAIRSLRERARRMGLGVACVFIRILSSKGLRNAVNLEGK